MTAIIFLILIVSLFFTVRKQYVLVFIFSFLGSISDSASLTFLLNTVFPSFSYMMFALMFVASIISLFQRSSLNKKNIPKRYYIWAIICIVAFAVISFLQEMNIAVDLKIIARFITFFVDQGIASFVIFLCWIDRFDIKKYLFVLVLSHCFLAFFTLYGGLFGISFSNLLNFALYVDPNTIGIHVSQYGEPLLIRGDVLTIFQNKYSNFVFACFGNPNILGFYSGTLCLLSVLNIFRKEHLILSIISLALGGILWLDAGTKAPLVAVVVVVLYDFWRRNKKMLPIIILAAAICIPVAISFYNNKLSEGVSTSIESRESLLQNEWPFFFDHFFVGKNSLDHLDASPHQLWLLYGTECGIFGLLFALIYFYVFPIMDFRRKRNHYIVGVLALLFLISNTNNYTSIVLFMTLFASFVAEVYLARSEPKKQVR